MSDLKELLDQMYMDISSQAFRLVDVRLPGAHEIGGFVFYLFHLGLRDFQEY